MACACVELMLGYLLLHESWQKLINDVEERVGAQLEVVVDKIHNAVGGPDPVDEAG